MDLLALSNLLKESKNDSDSEDEVDTSKGNFTPGLIGPAKKPEQVVKKDVKDEKNIWDGQEVPEGKDIADTYDPRPQPDYEILFKQAIRTEDVFLGMSGRNTSSTSCENLLVKIKLPDTKYADVQLDVTDTFLDLRTPKYKLGLHLPHPCDSKNGNAKWDEDKMLLSVTLNIIREYDFLNR